MKKETLKSEDYNVFDYPPQSEHLSESAMNHLHSDFLQNGMDSEEQSSNEGGFEKIEEEDPTSRRNGYDDESDQVLMEETSQITPADQGLAP